jgi:dihydropteroate synthase
MIQLKTRRKNFLFPGPALVMGIVNITPDSFSDGGKFLDAAAAVDWALRLEAEGADILDIGGESSRPRALPVEEGEELRRVLPVLRSLAGKTRCLLSIDTLKPGVASAALQEGADILNDVGANRNEPRMWELAAESGAAYVCMHMQGTPATMQDNPQYADVVGEVGDFFADRIQRMRGCGLSAEQIILDPGIGFGKTLEHNLQLLAHVDQFSQFKRPLLLGVSRKSFLSRVAGAGEEERLPGGLACVCLARAAGVQIFRVHDVAATVQALRVFEAILNQA